LVIDPAVAAPVNQQCVRTGLVVCQNGRDIAEQAGYKQTGTEYKYAKSTNHPANHPTHRLC
jgi:hypothetical protein